MKKLSILVALILTLSLLAVSVFAAQSAVVTVTASSPTVHRGETVTVTVSVSAVESCVTGGFMFEYDENVFEYVEDSGRALVTGYTGSGVSTINGHLAGYFMGDAQAVEGPIFEITLKVKDDAAYGDYTVTGAPSIKTGTETVSCTVTAATITVACDHTNEYTDNGDGTHTATCTACGESVTEPHTFVDGSCACGATEVCNHEPGDAVIENLVESTWETVGSYDEVTYCTVCGEEISRVTKDALLNPFYSNAMELNCQLTLNFVIKWNTLPFTSGNAIKESGYYAIVTRTDTDGNRIDTTIPASDWQTHTKNRMRIPFSNWAPKQMSDALEVAIYNNNGEQISVVYETSVRAIAMSEIEQYVALGGYDTYVTLLVDMLNYGTASQNNFGYNTGDPANALLPDEWKAYATPDVSYSERKDNSSVAFYHSTAFALESRLEMQLVLYNTFGVDRSQVVAEVSYTTRTGKLVNKTVNGTDFVPHTKGRYKLVIDWMDIPDCQQDVTIVFKDINGNELGTVTESVMSALGYYSELLPDDPLYPALIKFINSATAYFAS